MRIQIFQPGSGGSASAGVNSFNSRQGNVVPQSGDYSLAQISGLTVGLAIVPTGASFLTITHGLGITPGHIQANLRIPSGGNNIFLNPIDNFTSQTFEVGLDASVESNLYKVDYLIII